MASQSFPESRQGLVEGAGAGLPGWPQALGTRGAAACTRMPPPVDSPCVCREAALNKHVCTKSAAQMCVTTGLGPNQSRAGLSRQRESWPLCPGPHPRQPEADDPLQELREQPFPSPWAGIGGRLGLVLHGKVRQMAGWRVTRLPLWCRVQALPGCAVRPHGGGCGRRAAADSSRGRGAARQLPALI